MSVRDLPITISWFESAILRDRPALGDPEHTTWGTFCEVFAYRREGEKDGPCFAPARFRVEADGRHVRRLLKNVVAYTAVCLDIETSKTTGEIPPVPQRALETAKAAGLACLVYTSHNHREECDNRYRMIFPLSEEVAPEYPAPEFVAVRLKLDGVLDRSKITPSSVFYLPSCEDEKRGGHFCGVVDGDPIDSAWIAREGEALLQAVQTEAQAKAAARAAARAAAGVNPEAQLIEKIRARLDLETVLASHGYDKHRGKFRHPNSSSGVFGANIKTLGGVQRVFSHNATDPLHADNLPEWCEGVTAVDAFDVAAILDFSGDRKKALRTLGERYGLTKNREKKTVAALIFRMIRQQAPQDEIELAALAEGMRLGLSREEVCAVAAWIAQKCGAPREAA